MDNRAFARVFPIPLIVYSCGSYTILIVIQGSAQDYLEVVKMGSDKHTCTYNIFQSNNNIKYTVVVWSLNDKDY